MHEKELLDRIVGREALVAVVGLGYVGSALADKVVGSGYETKGIDPFLDALPGELEGREGFSMHRDYSPVGQCDVIAVCVPTPLTENEVPDLTAVSGAIQGVATCLGSVNSSRKRARLVILESTTYPGTTRELFLPALTSAGLEPDRNVFIAYAPERVDPGRDDSQIPRVVGGISATASSLASVFYESLGLGVHVVGTPEAAEMSKLLENVFRAVNIALVNEMSLLCRRMDIDIWEVVEAAATKPFGFMPFTPGPGMGGHCIPVDPFYLAWRARQFGFYPEFIELAGKVNRNMPWHVVEWVGDALGSAGKSLAGSQVLVVGVAYKEDVADVRESPALKAIEILRRKGARVSYNDDYVPEIEVNGLSYCSVPITRATLEDFDCILIITAHSNLDKDAIADCGVPVVDTRNALGRHGS